MCYFEPIIQNVVVVRRFMAEQKMSLEKILFGVAAIATLGFFMLALWSPESLAPNPDWDVSDGCLGGQTDHDNDDGDVGIKYHYHPRLRVIVDGEDLQIPSNTGIDQNGCKGGMRWIHVHSSGVANNQAFTTIHIETPSDMNVPVGSFFKVWGREGTPSLTDDNKFDINGNGISDWDEYDISMTVSGNENTLFESYVMEDRQDIQITFNKK